MPTRRCPTGGAGQSTTPGRSIGCGTATAGTRRPPPNDGPEERPLGEAGASGGSGGFPPTFPSAPPAFRSCGTVSRHASAPCWHGGFGALDATPYFRWGVLRYNPGQLMIHELSAADVGRYYDDGFLIVEDLFSREEVAAMAAAAERLRAVGRDLAATLPASERKAETQQVERAGSQFVFGGANGSLRLLRVVWAGGCEPAFLACGRDLR